MVKYLNSNEVGFIVHWNDFILSKFRKDNEGNSIIEYKQSNTKLDGYCSRTIGVARRAGGYVIAVALSREDLTSKTERSGKGVIVHRIKTLIHNDLSCTAEMKGVTWIPDNYLIMVYNDPAAYNTLYGPIDPTTMKMAIRAFQNAEDQKIDRVYQEAAEDGAE